MITVVGLGPAGLERVPAAVHERLLDPDSTVIVRTLRHPAAKALADKRSVRSGDDLYESGTDFEATYSALAIRVVEAAERGDVVYAVPGSPTVGERTVPLVREVASRAGITVEVVPGESFLDLCYVHTGIDPVADGLQIVDGRQLPDPLPLHLPTLITQVDGPVVLADVAATLGKVLPDDHPVTVLSRLGDDDEQVSGTSVGALMSATVDVRTTLYLPPAHVGWLGLVHTNRVLRRECPWDADQTHHTLLKHLVEEAYETVDAISDLSAEAPGGDVDYVAYAGVEEELGDLLLQVVFHTTLAAEAGAFDVEEVAEMIRRKLVRRHPHVFGDVAVRSAGEVLANWETIKAAEKGRESLMDDIPTSLPGVVRASKVQGRAASVGFDWDAVPPVLEKVREELDELEAALSEPDLRSAELGDLLFAVVNLSRHIDVDAEAALRSATHRFERRFRHVESMGPMTGVGLDELDRRWEAAKHAEAAEAD